MRPSPGSGAAPASIAGLLERFPAASPRTTGVGAAVTAVLRESGAGVEVLLIVRTERDDDPASGQVALPGGRVDPGDRDLRETALRELEEEVGLTPADLNAPVRFVQIAPARRFGMSVGVFAGELARSSAGPAARQAAEVADIFWLPRAALATTDTVEMVIDGRRFGVPAHRHAGHVLWGFTRRVLREFFELGPDPGGIAPWSGVPVPTTDPPRGDGSAGRRAALSPASETGRPRSRLSSMRTGRGP